MSQKGVFKTCVNPIYLPQHDKNRVSSGYSWYIKLVSSLQISLLNENQFVTRVNLLYKNRFMFTPWSETIKKLLSCHYPSKGVKQVTFQKGSMKKVAHKGRR